jgi:hypothetical protein
MSGKSDSWFTRKASGLFGNSDTATVDYTRNDYDLFQSIYWASEMPTPNKNEKVGKEYILAASLAKPIINSASAFIVGSGYTIELDSPFLTPEQLEAATNEVNDWLEENKHNQLDLTKFGLRDGDSYLYINEKGEADMLDPRTVEVILDAMTSEQIGYDVTETVDEITDNGQTKAVSYIKKYRKNRLEIFRLEQNEELAPDKLYYSEVYTTEGTVVLFNGGATPEDLELDDDGNVTIFGEVVERPLPIVAIHNEAEPRAVYGNSELQNVLVHFRNYTGVMDESTKNVIYNGAPILAVKGAKKENMEDDEDDNGDKRMNFNSDTVLFLEGEKADAKFLGTTSVMTDAGQLLEYYFYLILQGSETPEFVFGAAVSSSKASVSEQMPIVSLKADRKRTAMTDSIKHMVRVIIDKQIRLSNPDMLPLEGFVPKIKVNFPDITDEDGNLTRETIAMLLEAGVISNKTALKLSAIGDKISDLDQEIKDAEADAKKAVENSAILPAPAPTITPSDPEDEPIVPGADDDGDED